MKFRLDECGYLEELSKEDAVKYCRMIWDELAETGGNSKRNIKCVDVTMFTDMCPACHYGDLNSTRCTECLFIWSDGGDCQGECGEFGEWQDAETIKDRKKWAKIISELPVREEC